MLFLFCVFPLQGITMYTYYKSLYICLIFMKRVSPFRSFTSILVIFFLLSSLVCGAENSFCFNTNTKAFVVAKRPNTPSKSDAQFPEKVESENDLKAHHNFFFIHQLSEFFQFNITKSQYSCFYDAFRFRGNTAVIPLYLIKRSIVI